MTVPACRPCNKEKRDRLPIREEIDRLERWIRDYVDPPPPIAAPPDHLKAVNFKPEPPRRGHRIPATEFGKTNKDRPL